MMEIEAFLAYAEERLATDEPLPCEPEDYAKMLVYLMALVPEYRLASQAEAADREKLQAERRRSAIDGFRRARGVAPAPAQNGGNGSNTDAGRSTPTEAA
jgi:hypothetical protein